MGEKRTYIDVRFTKIPETTRVPIGKYVQEMPVDKSEVTSSHSSIKSVSIRADGL